MIEFRKHRMFHADVTTNAPKDRTLFNYNIAEDGWPKLRDFLGLPVTEESFPHENKNADTIDFAQVSRNIFRSKYQQKSSIKGCHCESVTLSHDDTCNIFKAFAGQCRRGI